MSHKISLNINKTWTLFLDRDGVINVKKEQGYIAKKEEFVFLDGAVEAIAKLNSIFGITVVVTNQQGIGKGLYSHGDLTEIHQNMLQNLKLHGAYINEVYYAPQLEKENHIMRKPNIGMALHAKKDFPQIEFSKSIMVGDSITDMIFAKNCGMYSVFISTKKKRHSNHLVDYQFSSLIEFSNSLL